MKPPMTEMELEKMKVLYESGKTYKEVGIFLNRNPETIRKNL
jgi:DNA-binding CsgD family transcriptional regulator